MSDGAAPRVVRVIVVNYNSGPHLGRCLAALAGQSFTAFEAVVVDNGSTDGSLQAAMPDDPRFRALPLGKNLGFGVANNRGAADAQTPFVATLNPDAFPEPDWLAALVRAAERFPEAVMFGSTQTAAENPERFDGVGDAYFALGVAWRGEHGRPVCHPAPAGETFAPCAAAALYRTQAFRQAGGFDEGFFCYYEDVDLAFRLRLMGGRCVQVADAVVRHIGAATTGSASAFTAYHLARNQVWTFVKNMPGPLFWPLLAGHAVLQLLLLLRAATRGAAAPMARGLLDAVRHLRPVWRERQRIQAMRTVPWWRIARALTWSPAKWPACRADLRPLG